MATATSSPSRPGSDVASGLGDVAGLVKYRFYSFGSGQPDPGGLAVMATMRLPTGDTRASAAWV